MGVWVRVWVWVVWVVWAGHAFSCGGGAWRAVHAAAAALLARLFPGAAAMLPCNQKLKKPN